MACWQGNKWYRISSNFSLIIAMFSSLKLEIETVNPFYSITIHPVKDSFFISTLPSHWHGTKNWLSLIGVFIPSSLGHGLVLRQTPSSWHCTPNDILQNFSVKSMTSWNGIREQITPEVLIFLHWLKKRWKWVLDSTSALHMTASERMNSAPRLRQFPSSEEKGMLPK